MSKPLVSLLHAQRAVFCSLSNSPVSKLPKLHPVLPKKTKVIADSMAGIGDLNKTCWIYFLPLANVHNQNDVSEMLAKPVVDILHRRMSSVTHCGIYCRSKVRNSRYPPHHESYRFLISWAAGGGRIRAVDTRIMMQRFSCTDQRH
jgi:hypothetical protein